MLFVINQKYFSIFVLHEECYRKADKKNRPVFI